MSVSPKEATREMLEVLPLVMRTIRAEMRSYRALGLSVPQFRALGFVHRHPGASLSDVTEHIGVTLPAMSRMMDGLVKRKLIRRRSHSEDRRRITLEIAVRGQKLWQAAYDSTQASLTRKLSALNSRQCATLAKAMRLLFHLFARNPPVMPGRILNLNRTAQRSICAPRKESEPKS
jgi:DNA-binding MarR family transcriptional regulator